MTITESVSQRGSKILPPTCPCMSKKPTGKFDMPRHFKTHIYQGPSVDSTEAEAPQTGKVQNSPNSKAGKKETKAVVKINNGVANSRGANKFTAVAETAKATKAKSAINLATKTPRKIAGKRPIIRQTEETGGPGTTPAGAPGRKILGRKPLNKSIKHSLVRSQEHPDTASPMGEVVNESGEESDQRSDIDPTMESRVEPDSPSEDENMDLNGSDFLYEEPKKSQARSTRSATAKQKAVQGKKKQKSVTKSITINIDSDD